MRTVKDIGAQNPGFYLIAFSVTKEIWKTKDPNTCMSMRSLKTEDLTFSAYV